MKNISLITSVLLLSSSLAIAESNSIAEAFEQGTASGNIALYTQSIEQHNSNNDFTAGSIGLNYQTDSFDGFIASFGVRGQHEFSTRDDGTSAYENNAIVNEASLQIGPIYGSSFISIGRQEIDLEWLSNYNKSIYHESILISAIPFGKDITITLGYTNRKAEVGIDLVEDFNEPSGVKKGAYVVDIKTNSFKAASQGELIFYLYSLPDVAEFYGAKLSIDGDIFGATFHFAKTNEEVLNNGDILNIEGRYRSQRTSFAVGYIQTDPLGTGNLTAFGDNISPFEDGDNIYNPDAITLYGTIGYKIADIELDALYRHTEFTNNDESELNLSISYSFSETLSLNALYVKYSDDNPANNDFDKLSASISYSF